MSLGSVHRDDVKSSMLDTRLRCNLVRHVADFGHGSAQHRRFQTVDGIQMQMKRSSGYLVMVMLSLHEPGGERTLTVVVQVDDAADTFHVLLLLDLLGGKELPYGVAHPFGSVSVAFGFDVSIEILQQILIDRDRYPLHLVPAFVCFGS
jgi:hypothetical protein